MIGVDLGVAPTDYKSICVMKKHKDGTIEVLNAFSTQDSTLFKEKKKELENLYPLAFVMAIKEDIKDKVNDMGMLPTFPKKSRKTKDIKSFNSKNYEMFKDGFFNCDNVPYGYNFAVGMCLDSINFEKKGR